MMQTQGDTLQAHTHGAYDTGHTHKYTDTYAQWGGGRNGHAGPKDKDYKNDEYEYKASRTTYTGKSNIKVTGVSGATTSSETRPKNMFVVYIMKVF